MCRIVKTLFVLFFLVGWVCYADGAVQEKQMNVILILADDLGAADTFLGGSTFHQTPNLDRLAQRGMVFSNAYASVLCSPTRASILSGQSPARTGFTAPHGHLPAVVLEASERSTAGANSRQTVPTSVTRLSTEHISLGKALKQAGYTTGQFGKWHLGTAPYSPLEHGFDVDIPLNFSGPGPHGGYVAPWAYPSFEERYPKEHIEDRMGDEAVAFMENNLDGPFFLNYWQFSVHGPFDAKEELIDYYQGQVDPQNPQQSPTYAAMIHSLDDNVGKILDAVDRLGIARDTIIIFYSDDGGNMYNLVDGTTATSNAPFRGGKGSIYEGGVRVPAAFIWPHVIQGGTHSEALFQSEDLYATILEMVGVPLPPNQALDSISAVPVFKGGPPQREAVYTFFPHGPTVPDHLPPSASVRQGDWKLIRIFYDSSDQSHRYELYNLRDDVGERVNLAGQYPERVQQMDQMIEAFLNDTNAALPQLNPNYDPDFTYQSGGWQGVGYVHVEGKDAGLQVRSFGEDPMRIQTAGLDLVPGDYALEFKLRSLSASGSGQVAWAETSNAFDEANTREFNVIDDGLWHEYRLELQFSETVGALRMMPASTQGVVHIEWIRLKDSNDMLVTEWEFK